MSVDEGYAVCPTCRTVYRPGVEASRRAHFDVHGHWPPDHPVRRPTPPPRPDEEPVTGAELLQAAARRVHELQAVIDGLDELATTWEKAPVAHRSGPGLHEAAAMLRGYLARPPIHAQGEEVAADG